MHDLPGAFLGFRLLLLAAIILVNAFFAAAEVSLLSVRESRLRQLAEGGNAGAKLALNLIANPEQLLSVTQVGVTLASLGLGWAGEDTLYEVVVQIFGPILHSAPSPLLTQVLHGLSFLIAFLVMTFTHVVIGEVVPKNLAIAKADRLAVTVAPILIVITRIAAPFVAVIEKSAAAISAALGVRRKMHAGGHSPEELRLIVSSSRGSGHLREGIDQLIHRVLDMDEVTAREIMIPRNQMVAIEANSTLDQVLATMSDQQHSRLPVYAEKPEQVLGVLYFKDMLHLWQERRVALRAGTTPRPFDIRQIMRKHMVVPETKPLFQILNEFRSGQTHIAMVVDEFGTISGLLTVEDVLEQIVGEIEDEFDDPPEHVEPESREMVMDGATKIRDFEMQFDTKLETGTGYETLAGYLLYRLGHIPAAGEFVEHEGRRFTVQSVARNRITSVKVEKLLPA